MYAFYGILVGISVALYFLLVVKHTGLLTASSIFVALQTLMGLGTLTLLEDIEADAQHGLIIVVSTVLLVGCSILVQRLPSPAKNIDRDSAHVFNVVHTLPSVPIGALVILSIITVTLYYSAMDQSAFIAGVRMIFAGEEWDVASIRLESYSGVSYLFPGYVNQFKNALLPALAIVLTHAAFCARRHRIWVTALIVFVSLGLLGTGQRGAFIQAAIVAVTYMYWSHRGRLPRAFGMVALGTLILFLLSTLATGRTQGMGGSLVSQAVRSVLSRVFVEQQMSSIYAFRYIHDVPIQNGREWLAAFQGVLPGPGGSTLANAVFEVIYGTARGTAPPSLWGSIFHNFGWSGIILAPIVLALILGLISNRALKVKQRSSIEVVGMSGTFVCMGMWVAGSPDILLNIGLVPYVFLWLWGSGLRRRQDISRREDSNSRSILWVNRGRRSAEDYFNRSGIRAGA